MLLITGKLHKSSRWLGCLAGALMTTVAVAVAAENTRPNILLIVADDLGYSDLGSFGGEIETPTLDALADSGVRMTSFHTAPTCSPTRSMLLTGTDSHQAGLGNMAEVLQPNQKGKPGYEGYLNTLVATLPEVLQQAGYHTYMAGKWHLGRTEEQSPAQRGFEESYALVQGGASHFDDQKAVIANDPRAVYRENGKSVDLPNGFFSSQFYTDRLIQNIETHLGDGKPFFAYAAYTAPHWPLHAPDEYLAKYKGRYDQGYEQIRQARLKQMKTLGIVDSGMEANIPLQSLPSWDELTEEQRKVEARKMEVYAAMVDNLDHHIGRLLDYLKRKGELENTVILFMSDNGADGNSPEPLPGNKAWIASEFDNSLENMGRKNSYIWYGPQWGQVGATPFPLFKGFTSQGGIVTPAILSYPGQKSKGEIVDKVISVMDVMPTFLELAGVDEPGDEFKGRKVFPIQGKSILKTLAADEERTIGWELFGRRAIRKGDWKIRLLDAPYGSEKWELFNLKVDPTERNNLADTEPGKLAELIAEWQRYQDKNGVYPSDPVTMKKIGYSFKTCLFDHCVN